MSIRSYPARLLLLTTILIALTILFCVLIATRLNTAQSSTAEILRENIGSRREADSFKESLTLLSGGPQARPVPDGLGFDRRGRGRFAFGDAPGVRTGAVAAPIDPPVSGAHPGGHLGAQTSSVVIVPDGDPLDVGGLELLHCVELAVARLQEKEREVQQSERLAMLGQLATGVAHLIGKSSNKYFLCNDLTSIRIDEGSPVGRMSLPGSYPGRG